MQVEIELAVRQRTPKVWVGACCLDFVGAGSSGRAAREFAFCLRSLDDWWAATLKLALAAIRPKHRIGLLTVRAAEDKLLETLRSAPATLGVLDLARGYSQIVTVRQPATKRLETLLAAQVNVERHYDSGTKFGR